MAKRQPRPLTKPHVVRARVTVLPQEEPEVVRARVTVLPQEEPEVIKVSVKQEPKIRGRLKRSGR